MAFFIFGALKQGLGHPGVKICGAEKTVGMLQENRLSCHEMGGGGVVCNQNLDPAERYFGPHPWASTSMPSNINSTVRHTCVMFMNIINYMIVM